MSLQKKLTINWPVVLFGLMGVGIVVATVVFIVVFLKKYNDRAERTATLVSDESPVAVREGYAVEISGLRTRVENEDMSSEELLIEIEGTLLAARVPKEKLNVHLQALLNIQNLKKDSSGKSESDVRTEAFSIIDQLLATE